jgi:hypothetical protein
MVMVLLLFTGFSADSLTAPGRPDSSPFGNQPFREGGQESTAKIKPNGNYREDF